MKISKLALLAFLLCVPNAFAGPFAVTSSQVGAGWHAVGSINENGSPAWDTKSFDARPCNIGHVLTNQNACGNQVDVPSDPLYWFGNADGSLPGDFLIHAFEDYQVEYIFGVTSKLSQDAIYYSGPGGSGTYSPANNVIGTKTEYAASSSISLLGYYGAWPQNCQRFALFAPIDMSTLFVGFEDGPCATGDFDHNDNMLRFTIPSDAPPPDVPTTIPEPASLLLVGTGILALLRKRV